MKKDEHKDFSSDMRKLNAMIKQIPADRRAIAEKLAKEIIFMAAILEELRQSIQENGAVDLFKQRGQEFLMECRCPGFTTVGAVDRFLLHSLRILPTHTAQTFLSMLFVGQPADPNCKNRR